ncbi:MAB_1171c family putative transporter [Streptomyces sp. enrichment culture]|uniref:MAB_1171c family putative transporter n=1 Tax=Streptomyces sp. enrichment culture TaxID=1795815 RepID=UPI003F5739CB
MPLIALLSIGVLWKGIDLARASHDRVLRFLVASLLMLLCGEVLSLPEVNGAIDAATAVGVGKVAFNGIYMSGLFSLILFFTSSARSKNGSYRRQVRTNASLLAGALIALAISMAATPATMRGHSLGTPYMAEPTIASFYIIGNAYFVYAYLASAVWALRYGRKASRHLGLGLCTMALGLLGLTITAVNRMILVILRIDKPGSHEAFNTVNWSITDWAMGIVLIGICYSACVQLITRLRSIVHHRRMYHELTPLWTALTTAYPELVLNRTPAGSNWDRLRQPGTHEQRFYRRLIECRDGLVRLSPYVTRVAPDADLAHGPADQIARHITKALALKQTSESPHTELSAARIALPASNDLGADARELIAVSHALRERKS